MSELSDHRDAFLQLVAESHGLISAPRLEQESVLPSGYQWVPHTPKPGPPPPRRRAPSSEFIDLCCR